ncbi:MAG: hypothetical protein HDR03_03330 [Lachnospiraceae bacterium]|nr:hypothetical protein [Lachnospiraceae bacterium]
MKAKIIMIIDVILIVITTFYVLYINNRESSGMAALGDLGRFVLGLGFLGVEILILIIVCIIIIYKKLHKS